MLLQEEERLRLAAVDAFAACKEEIRQHTIEWRTEHIKVPCTPDVFSQVHDAWQQGGEDHLLRNCACVDTSAFDSAEAWDTEGPGAYTNLARKLSEVDAPVQRARELSTQGPGTAHTLLGALAAETATAVGGLQAPQVLVLGGNGACGVVAARSGAARVVVWEPRQFVAMAAREVLRRNLDAGLLGRCTVEESAKPPAGCWDLVVVELWDASGGFSAGPLPALKLAAETAGPGNIKRVIPSRVTVEIELGDGSLSGVSGFDLDRMDVRFRNLSIAALRMPGAFGEDAEAQCPAHPTSFRPKRLTTVEMAFDLDLSGGGTDAAQALLDLDLSPDPVPLALVGEATGRASCSVIKLSFWLAPLGAADVRPAATLRFAQWLAGGLAVTEGEEVASVSARRGPGRIWVDWDWSLAEEPPFGYMSLSEWYFEMLRDGARHDLYEQAIKAEVAAVRERTGDSCRVLDVGSGDGILSMMSLRAGATGVVGCEVVTSIARACEQIVETNRQGELPPAEIAPLDIWCSDVRGVTSPPDEKKFHLLVSELMDASGLGENLIQLMKSSRERLCLPGAACIPARLRLIAVLCEVRLPTLAGVQMDAFWPFWPTERASPAPCLWTAVDLDKREGDFRVLSEPMELLSLELGVADASDVRTRAELQFSGTADGVATSVVWWFETQLSAVDPSIVLTNAPKVVDTRHAATCWGQAMADLTRHVDVKAGDTVGITMEIPFGDYQLTFRPSGASKIPRPFTDAPPGTEAFSEEFFAALKAYRATQKSIESSKQGNRVGHRAMRTADISALNALQRNAMYLAAQPYLFGIEPFTAAKMLGGWFAVGGEGRA